jgi:hypothetical protein
MSTIYSAIQIVSNHWDHLVVITPSMWSATCFANPVVTRARRHAIVWPLYRTIIARLSCDCDTNTIKCDTNCYRVVRY